MQLTQYPLGCLVHPGRPPRSSLAHPHFTSPLLSSLRFTMPPPWYRGSRTEPVASQASADGPDEDFISPAGPSTLERPRDCINKHPTPAFAVLCSMMDRLRSEEAGKRKDTLQRFFRLWREKVGSDLYPLIRLLLPDVSGTRGVGNIEERKDYRREEGRSWHHADSLRETGRDRCITSKKPCWPNATSRCSAWTSTAKQHSGSSSGSSQLTSRWVQHSVSSCR